MGIEEIDKLVMDINTLETKVTNTELLLLAKEVMLEEKELELNQSSQYGLEKDSGLKIAEVRIKSLEDELSNIESIKIEIEQKNNEVNEVLRQELENLGKERGELQNKLESTDGIIRDLRVEVDGLNIVVDEKSQQYNIELQKSADAFSSNEEFSTSISTLQNENKHLQEERLEYEKTMIEKTVELENQINVLVSDVAELKSECDRNNKTIIDLTAEKDAAIEMNDKLSETEDAKVEEIDKLVIDNNTLETKVTNTELLLLAKEEELEEKELELNQSSQYGSEKDSGLKIAEVRIKSLEDDLSNIESIKLEIEQKSIEVNEANERKGVEHEKINEELRQELENLGKERGELQNKLESTDGIIRDLRVEVDGLNIVVDEKSQQYNIELQKSADAFSSNEEFSTSISTLQNENKHLQEERLEYEKTMIEKTVELRQIKETVEKERINAADFEHEKKRQVNYLEKENLQILEELKASKRNFIKMKTLNKMQSSNPGENLIEKYKKKTPPRVLQNKESRLNISLQKDCNSPKAKEKHTLKSAKKKILSGLNSNEDMEECSTEQCSQS